MNSYESYPSGVLIHDLKKTLHENKCFEEGDLETVSRDTAIDLLDCKATEERIFRSFKKNRHTVVWFCYLNKNPGNLRQVTFASAPTQLFVFSNR